MRLSSNKYIFKDLTSVPIVNNVYVCSLFNTVLSNIPDIKRRLKIIESGPQNPVFNIISIDLRN